MIILQTRIYLYDVNVVFVRMIWLSLPTIETNKHFPIPVINAGFDCPLGVTTELENKYCSRQTTTDLSLYKIRREATVISFHVIFPEIVTIVHNTLAVNVTRNVVCNTKSHLIISLRMIALLTLCRI